VRGAWRIAAQRELIHRRSYPESVSRSLTNSIAGPQAPRLLGLLSPKTRRCVERSSSKMIRAEMSSYEIDYNADFGV
jgi:hypothetical protein